jgi:hypothetical protein
MTKLAEINQITSQHNGEVLFDEPLQIKSSPHSHLFTAWGVCVGPDGLYVMDSEAKWQGPLLEGQVNSEYMINSLYQRLKVMELKTSVVVASYDKDVNAVIFE